MLHHFAYVSECVLALGMLVPFPIMKAAVTRSAFRDDFGVWAAVYSVPTLLESILSKTVFQRGQGGGKWVLGFTIFGKAVFGGGIVG